MITSLFGELMIMRVFTFHPALDANSSHHESHMDDENDDEFETSFSFKLKLRRKRRICKCSAFLVS